jgi:transcriptional regulator with XRE-family HTH domain
MLKRFTMKTEDVLRILTSKQGSRSLRDFAQEIGCSAAYLSDIYNGNRQPGPKILTFLGMKKTRVVETSYAKSR